MGPALIYIQSPCWQQASYTQHPHFSHPHPPQKKFYVNGTFSNLSGADHVLRKTGYWSWSIEYNKLRRHAFDVSSQMLGKIVLWPNWIDGFFVCYTLSDLNMRRVNTNVLLKFIVWRPSSSASSLIFTILLLNASWGPPSILGAGGAPSCSYNYDDDHDNQESPHWFISNHCGWQASP